MFQELIEYTANWQEAIGKRQLATFKFLETSKKAFAASLHWSEGISYWRQPSCTFLKGYMQLFANG
jgi:hypothetical protein